MEPNYEDLWELPFKAFYSDLLVYICGRLKYGLQKNISAKHGDNFSESRLSQFKQKTEWNSSTKTFIKTLISRLVIDFEIQNGKAKFIGGVENDVKDDKLQQSELTFFETNKGNEWAIYSHLTRSNSEDNTVEKRYLKITSLKDNVEYIIKSKTHSDYLGYGRISNEGGYLIFDLQTRKKLKDLHIRFSIVGPESTPDIMLGVLVHSLAKENSIACHRVVAVNISGTNQEETPVSIPFEEFKQTDRIIAEYFESSCSMFASPHGVITYPSLVSHNKKVKAKPAPQNNDTII